MKPAFGAHVEFGPPLSVSHEQLPLVAVSRQAYDPQLHVSPLPGQPSSAQHTPWVTEVLEHEGPVTVEPDWRRHTHSEELEVTQVLVPLGKSPHAEAKTSVRVPKVRRRCSIGRRP